MYAVMLFVVGAEANGSSGANSYDLLCSNQSHFWQSNSSRVYGCQQGSWMAEAFPGKADFSD